MCIYIYVCALNRIVNLAHDVDISQDTLLHTCARHLKTSGHVSILHCVDAHTFMQFLKRAVHTVYPMFNRS